MPAGLEPGEPRAAADGDAARRVLDGLAAFGPLLALKLYRMTIAPAPALPVLPCLDHEAMLHGGIAPHAAAYLRDRVSGDLHEIVCYPALGRIDLDTVSTWGESSPDSRARLQALIAARFPEYRLRAIRPSWWRGDRRVAAACRAQVSLRDVLEGPDIARLRAAIERLETIGALMEKQSRVASWGARTVTGPLLTAAAVITYLALGAFEPWLGGDRVTGVRYGLIGILGAAFLCYGLKAVQLTDMANRVWKRTAEYRLILAERERLDRAREE